MLVTVSPVPEFCFGQMGGQKDGQTMSKSIVADRLLIINMTARESNTCKFGVTGVEVR